MRISFEDGDDATFNVIYPALGCTPRTELLARTQVERSDIGCLIVTPRQETNVAGLFAAGDVVDALDQISVAVGHGAIAATSAHNLLFTDVVMPDTIGRALAEQARRERPDLKVLFTTGSTRNAVVHHGTLDPGVALLTKPFTIEQLAAKVRQMLDAD